MSRNSADAECIICKRTFTWFFTEPRACPSCLENKNVPFKGNRIVSLNSVELIVVQHVIVEVLKGNTFRGSDVKKVFDGLTKERDRVIQAGGNYYSLMTVEDLRFLIKKFQ